MNKEEKFELLFRSYMNNTISDEDHQQLMQWIDEGNYDPKIKKLVKEFWQENAAEKDIDPVRTKQILEQILTGKVEKTGEFSLGRQIKSKSSRHRLWKTMAVAATVLILVTTGSFFFKENRFGPTVPEYKESERQPVVYKGKQYVRLPDGSTVMLNEGSELSYEDTFGAENREIRLSGEGYFDIQRDTLKPFIVRTGKVATTVLGTAFNIKAYPEEQEIKVTVTRGKVQVGDDKQTYGIITPNQQITVNTDSYQHNLANVKAEMVASWKDQYLVLDDLTLEDAVARIAAKYDTTIEIANENLRKCRITATFLHGEDLEHVLTVISDVLEASHKTGKNGKIIIDGNGCTP